MSTTMKNPKTTSSSKSSDFSESEQFSSEQISLEIGLASERIGNLYDLVNIAKGNDSYREILKNFLREFGYPALGTEEGIDALINSPPQ